MEESNLENINIRKREIGEEAVSALKNNNFYGAILLGTGAGKTWVILKSLEEIEKIKPIKSILYTCNSIDLRDKDFPKEVEKWGYNRFLSRMERMCYQSAHKLRNIEYDVLLGDESDFMATEEYINLLKFNRFKYIILVSATLSPDKLKLLKTIEPKIPVVYKKELNELEDAKVLNKSKYYYVNFLLNEEENAKYLYYNRAISRILRDSGFNDPEMEFVLRNRKLFLNRLKSSREVCRQLLKTIEGRTLVFSEITSQIDKICEYTYHGKNEEDNNLELFRNGDIDILGVCGKVNRGVNIHRVENVVKESGDGSKTKIVQQLGRGKRLGIDEILNVYMQVPHYVDRKGKIQPTIVKSWLEKALKDFNIPEIEVFKF